MSPRTSDDVGYPLQAKAVVFDDGESQVAYVQNDLIFVRRQDFDRAKARAEELTGIPAANIMMAATHTHFGPDSRRSSGSRRTRITSTGRCRAWAMP